MLRRDSKCVCVFASEPDMSQPCIVCCITFSITVIYPWFPRMKESACSVALEFFWSSSFLSLGSSLGCCDICMLRNASVCVCVMCLTFLDSASSSCESLFPSWHDIREAERVSFTTFWLPFWVWHLRKQVVFCCLFPAIYSWHESASLLWHKTSVLVKHLFLSSCTSRSVK